MGPLSAVGCPLSADDGLYSRKKEGSGAFRRPGSIVPVLRTERWVQPGIGFAFRAGSEGSYVVSLRRETVFPKARRFRRLTASGFKPPLGGRPWQLRFRPQSGPVQRGVIKPTPWRQGGRRRRHFIMRPKGATTPFEPFEPSEPSEPELQGGSIAISQLSARRGVNLPL